MSSAHMDRTLHYIDKVDWAKSSGYRVRVPVNGRNIHRTFSAKKLGVSMERALELAIRERDRLMREHDVKWPYPTKPKPLSKIYGVYRIRRKIRGKWHWYWMAN
jgi:hypothetical protein